MILNEPQFRPQLEELINTIQNITDEDLIATHLSYTAGVGIGGPKSLSVAINQLLRERLIAQGWKAEPAIFQGRIYQERHWRLDFAKMDVSIEVAFNHGEAIAWNLIKPILASELNHVQKQIQTQIGVIICATNALKFAGGFDSAVGTYEKFLDYLPVLRNLLTTPLLVIGLLPPETFSIVHEIDYRGRKYGLIQRN